MREKPDVPCGRDVQPRWFRYRPQALGLYQSVGTRDEGEGEMARISWSTERVI
jgi:hypothetical protein